MRQEVMCVPGSGHVMPADPSTNSMSYNIFVTLLMLVQMVFCR
jgi:hypothetical protein